MPSTFTSSLLRPSELVRGVEVRLIRPEERGRWDELVRAHHYLGLRSLVGKTLRYVAVFEKQWLALLGWQAAALKCGARERWVGWPGVLKYQRLHLVANNARFLMLPGIEAPNLASRILSLNLRRLSGDWHTIYGHPILLAETFVETPRFTGACYRAANWIAVGYSRGFAKKAGRYVRHDRPKQVLLYPLHRFARRWLAGPHTHPSWRPAMQKVWLSTRQMEDLWHVMQALPDSRKARGLRHRFATVLAITVAAVLGGARGYTAIAEFSQRLPQKQLKRLRARYDKKSETFEAPSEPTIRRVLQSADAEAVDRALGGWLMANAASDAIAVDGKTVKGAVRENGRPVHLLSAFLHHQGVTVAQKEVGEKTNEIPELPRMLEAVDIAGRVVTADAMHTQRETARFLVEDKKAHYLFTAKENQKNLLADIADHDWALSPPGR